MRYIAGQRVAHRAQRRVRIRDPQCALGRHVVPVGDDAIEIVFDRVAVRGHHPAAVLRNLVE
ncbi:hypothetical protein [Burkholderia lata]|uniref:hypothetical protein n=1 Tax=Burkholderia lata (strain ATCC 17760 / DSM 23089 / LMG 22485 / NCIMB 9086 / R18194 / 383) TaxID=482957 RepID=UPI001C2EB341|nr:hypothetical protein [Burkholderia lata]